MSLYARQRHQTLRPPRSHNSGSIRTFGTYPFRTPLSDPGVGVGTPTVPGYVHRVHPNYRSEWFEMVLKRS